MARAEDALQALPFEHLIGSPLRAMVEAQALAAKSTIQFIQQVGFKQGDAAPTADGADIGEVRNVTFQYKRRDDATNQVRDFSLTVPILSIVPIPYIRVEEGTIDFTAKIVDVETENVNTSLSAGATVAGRYGNFLSPVKVGFKASFSYNRNTTSTSRFEKEYQMHVTVRAVQDDIPAGLAKVLNMLEASIRESPVPAPSPSPTPA